MLECLLIIRSVYSSSWQGRRMRCIGILGGMSPSSTELYYGHLNRGVRSALGGLHSADCLIRSVDFGEVEALQVAGDWEGAGQMLAEAAAGLEAGGAELLILATNTMHKVPPLPAPAALPARCCLTGSARLFACRWRRRSARRSRSPSSTFSPSPRRRWWAPAAPAPR